MLLSFVALHIPSPTVQNSDSVSCAAPPGAWRGQAPLTLHGGAEVQMWPHGVDTECAVGLQAAALELPEVAVSPAQLRPRISLGGGCLFSSSGLLSTVLVQFPGPGSDGPLPAFSCTAQLEFINWAGHLDLAMQLPEMHRCPTISISIAA